MWKCASRNGSQIVDALMPRKNRYRWTAVARRCKRCIGDTHPPYLCVCSLKSFQGHENPNSLPSPTSFLSSFTSLPLPPFSFSTPSRHSTLITVSPHVLQHLQRRISCQLCSRCIQQLTCNNCQLVVSTITPISTLLLLPILLVKNLQTPQDTATPTYHTAPCTLSVRGD